jgi:hypothetical protein
MLTGEVDPAIRAFGIGRFAPAATAAGRAWADHQQTELA